MKHFYFRTFIIISSFFLTQFSVFAQICDPTVPVFPIDFTGHPDTTWTITNITRNGLCCLATNPNRCIEFVITMDVAQQGISLNSSGGPALGAGGIQVECDSNTYSFLDTICLSGIGPHHITLCKPGGNAYDYFITSIPKPNAGPPIAVSNGCTGIIYANGYVESSLVWTSVSPGAAGAYNMYLNCPNGCDTVVVTAQPGYPDSVLYQVTGSPIGGCSAMTITDSVWVFFVNDKTATILPANPVICAGSTSAVLTANGTGGLPPYVYLWSTGQTTQSISVGVGTYWVQISDQTNCPTPYDTVIVNGRPNPVADFTSTNACANSGMIFSDASTITPGSIVSWNWNFGDGNTSIVQNPVHVYATSGSFTITLVVTSSDGCTNSISKTVTVSPTPVAAFSANTTCYADSVHFIDNSTISSGTINSWTWNFGDGNTSTVQDPTHFYSTAGVTNISLIVTSALGCSNVVIIPMDIEQAPTADFSFTPGCVNTPVMFFDSSSITAGTITSWNWNFGDGNTSTLQNPSHPFSAISSYNITLVVTTASGCKDTIVRVINVNQSPVAGFTANALCYTDSVRFINTSSIGSGSISSWNWNFGDGNTSTIQDPAHDYLISGNTTVTLIATSNLGCADTATVVIDVEHAPIADFAFSLPGCVNIPVMFSDSSSIIAGAITGWSWNFGDGNTSTLQNPSHPYAAAGPYNITLVVTTASGCIDTLIQALNIDPSPVAGFTTNAMCYADSVRFINTSSISSGSIASWTWNFGDGNTGTSQDPAHFYLTGGNATVTLIATSALGCKDTAVLVIDVEQAPVANFSFTPGCANTSVLFSDSSSIGAGTITGWNWNFGDGNSSTLQNPSHPYAANGPYNVTLIVTAASGCSDTIVKVITIDPSPVAGFTTNAFCYADSVRFINTSSIGSGSIASWSWNFGDGNTSTAQDPTHFYLTSGNTTITLIATSALGCKDTATVIVDIEQAPAADFSALSGCVNSPIAFNDSSSIGAGSITSWSWDLGDGNSSILQNPSHPYAAGGPYNVTLIVTAASGCTDTISQILNIQSMPVANAGSDTSSCSNNPGLTLNGLISNAGGGIWSGSGSFSPGVTTLNPSYMPTAAAVSNGTDTLFFVTTSNALCPADTDQVVITFTPSPTINAGGNVSVCKDTISVPLCAIVTTATGALWQTAGSGTFANAAAVCTNYTPSNSDILAGSVTLYVTSTGNGTCFADSDTMTITFTSTPIVTITSNDSSCAGNPFNISVITTTGSGFWTTNGTGSFVPGSSTLNGAYYPSAADDAAGNVIFYFTSTNNGGCQPQHDTLNGTLIPSPTGVFTSVSACPSFPVIFSDASTSTGTIVSWNWNFGDGTTSLVHNPSHVYNTGGTYNATLIVTSNNGCVDTVKNDVIVYGKPMAIYSADGICLNEGVQFTDSSTVAGSTITLWDWNFGDATSSAEQNPFHHYPSGNIYNTSLIIGSAQGCTDTAAQAINILTGPFAGFAADDVIADVDQTVHFTDQSTNGAVTWLWNFGDSSSDSTSTVQNPSHVYRIGGFYDVCLYATDINGCTDTICKQEIVTIPPSVPTGFTPNGDGQNDIFYVYGGPFKKLEFKIYNNWGELIFTSDKQSNGWDGKRKGIDQPIGVYVYTVDGTTEDDKEHHLSGDVTLLR